MKKSLWTFCARHIAGWSLHRIPMRVLWCFTPVTTMTHSWVSFSYLSFGNFLSPKLLDEIMRVNLGLGRDCGSVGIVVTSDTTQRSAVWIQSLAKFIMIKFSINCWKDENKFKNIKLNFLNLGFGREPWSSGLRRILVFEKSRVRIPAQYTGWLIFHFKSLLNYSLLVCVLSQSPDIKVNYILWSLDRFDLIPFGFSTDVGVASASRRRQTKLID